MTQEAFEYRIDPETGVVYSRVNSKFKSESDEIAYKAMLKQSGIPKEYWDLTWEKVKDNYTTSKDSFNKAMRYIRKKDDEALKNVSLFLTGPNLSGKTTVACLIGQGFLRAGKIVHYVLANNLALLFHNSFSYGDDDAKAKLKNILRADLLIIDEIFDDTKVFMYKDPDSKLRIVAMWDQTLRTHISEGRRLVLLSNQALDKARSYSTSIFELLDSNCRVLEFKDNVKGLKKQRIQDALEKD
jgi:chromosomal replication initiation ATPase DnaA